MLFSDERIAKYINRNFEPVWISVRDVPVVTVDLGNNKKITRTLHGNVATLLCNSRGYVLDVVPGIYEPVAYLDRLTQWTSLHSALKIAAIKDKAVSEPYRLLKYHQRMAELLAKNEKSHLEYRKNSEKHSPKKKAPKLDASKILVIEGPLKTGLFTKRMPLVNISVDVPKKLAKELNPKKAAALWKSLVEDTEHNETVRRLKIHQHLAEHGLVRPSDIKKWLYREVLQADLDDPYFGLGKLLFDSYPFDDGISMRK